MTCGARLLDLAWPGAGQCCGLGSSLCDLVSRVACCALSARLSDGAGPACAVTSACSGPIRPPYADRIRQVPVGMVLEELLGHERHYWQETAQVLGLLGSLAG